MTAPSLAPQLRTNTVERLNGEIRELKKARSLKVRNRKPDCRISKAKPTAKRVDLACGRCRSGLGSLPKATLDGADFS